jgi:hypothetical protein
MISFQSVLPELAQREVRCVQLGPVEGVAGGSALPEDEYAFLEFYCADLGCDCRRVLFQVIAKNQPGKIFATINYGWEKEKFYRKRIAWDPDAGRKITRGELDPINAQSEFAGDLLELFRKIVLDEPYRFRLRRHYNLFREAIAKAAQEPGA